LATQAFLSPLNFKFKLTKIPNFENYVQSVNLPAIQAGVTPGMSNPFQTIAIPGEHMRFEPLKATFKVNESMSDYLDIFNWIQGIGKPHDFEQRSKLQNAPIGQGLQIEASLLILNNHLHPFIKFDFWDLYPTELSELEFNTTASDLEYITASVTFEYTLFTTSLLTD